MKVAPVLGILYLASARRWREAHPCGRGGGRRARRERPARTGAWRDFFAIVIPQAGTSEASLLPIPFPIRLGLGAVLAVVAGQLVLRGRQRAGESLLVVALVAANPTLWVTALSLLIAIVPLWRSASPRRTEAGATLPVSGT